jgi:hypothetical protein
MGFFYSASNRKRCSTGRVVAFPVHSGSRSNRPAVAVRKSLGDSLTGYHTPHATSRVLHIALTTRDQVYMGMADSLPGSIAAVHADVKAT